jgi:hypothetical protein
MTSHVESRNARDVHQRTVSVNAHIRGVVSALPAICVSTCARRKRVQAGAIAITRRGLPLPLTILSGAAITTAPVGGN